MTPFEHFQSAGVCSAELTFEDLDTGESITLKDEDLAIGENNITFSTELLTDNRHYNVAANASSVAGSSTSYATLSKDSFSFSGGTQYVYHCFRAYIYKSTACNLYTWESSVAIYRYSASIVT